MNGDSMTNGGSSSEGWTGLMKSMIGFTNTATMFSIQQMQNFFGMFTDSKGVANRFSRAVDSLSDAMNREMNGSHRSTVNQMNRVGMEAVDTLSGSGQESSRSSGQEDEALAGRKH